MMKKIIFIVIIIFCFYRNVYAETFYGEYRLVNEIGNYKEDEVLVENYRVYNTYKKEYIDLGYMEDNDNYLKDENDYIEKTFYDLESDEYIEIVTPTKNLFQFIFYDIPDNVFINEIEIYNDIDKLNYHIYNEYSYVDTIKYIKDNNFNTIFNYGKEYYLLLLLDKMYDINNLKIIIYTEECKDIDIELLVGANRVPISLKNNKKKKHVITFRTDENIDFDQINYLNEKTVKLYKYYNEETIILNNYIKEGDNILLEDYKDINNIYVRDKLILKNDLIINNKNIKVLDLIEYSTDDVFVDCDINYDVNGIYVCSFNLNDINVSKEIIVDLEENENLKTDVIMEEEIKEYDIKDEISINSVPKEENIEIIDKKEIVIEESNNINLKKDKIEKINRSIKNKDVEVAKKSNNNVIKNITLTTKKVIVNDNKKIDSKENVNKKDNKTLLNYIKYGVFINFIIIDIVFYIKKRNRNNVERV